MAQRARILKTEREIEFNLEKGLTGKMVQYEDIFENQHTGILRRLATNTIDNPGEVMIVFHLYEAAKLMRHECDLVWFVEHLIIHYGDTYTGEKRNVRRILKGD